MTDINTDFELDKTTIATASHQCLESFATCLVRASAIHPREFSRVEDQEARFSTWTSGIGVFAPGRASMDHRLRYAPEVHSVAIGLLESLNHRIRKCSDIMDGHDKSPEMDISVLNEALERTYSDIASEISHLNKMSNMIRRASKENGNQALNIQDFQIKDEDKHVERTLLDNFKRHISDRFPISSDIIQQRLAEAMILRRKRILYWRYRQQEAATKLPKTDINISTTLPGPQPVVPLVQVNSPQEDKQDSRAAAPVVVSSQIQSATTLQPDKLTIAARSPSVASTVTIALSDHETLNFPPPPGANVKRKYEQLEKQRLAAHKIVLDKLDKVCPDQDSKGNFRLGEQVSRALAKEDLKATLEANLKAIGEIICPYCLEALPAIEVFDQRKWQKHVKNDLDPYVCLFEECNEPDELYKHSEKWLAHMHQHNQRWRCPSHRELDPFITREEYMQHMREAHNIKMGENKLLILANRNARKTIKLFTSCPLCGKSETEVGGRFENHIAGHLRSLALKSLPAYEDDIDDDVGSERDSCDGSQLRSIRTTEDLSIGKSSYTRGTDDEMPSLSETKGGNFAGVETYDLDSRHTDMWNSWVKDWISNKPTLQHLQQTSDQDPIFQFMLAKAKESHSLPQTSQLKPQQPTASQSPEWEEDGDLLVPTSEQTEAFEQFINNIAPIDTANQPHPSVKDDVSLDKLHIPSVRPSLGLSSPPVNPADQNPPCNTLYVGNLPTYADEEELKAIFSKQRGFKRLVLRSKRNGPMCFVEFEDTYFATKALHELYGMPLYNSRKGGIRLSFSENPLGIRSTQPPSRAYQANVPPISQEALFYDFLPSLSTDPEAIQFDIFQVGDHRHKQKAQIFIRPRYKLPDAGSVSPGSDNYQAMRPEVAAGKSPEDRVIAITKSTNYVELVVGRLMFTGNLPQPPTRYRIYFCPDNNEVFFYNFSHVSILLGHIYHSAAVNTQMGEFYDIGPRVRQPLSPGTFRIRVGGIEVFDFRITAKQPTFHLWDATFASSA